MPTRYYSTGEVCAVLGIHRATLYNWGPEPDIRFARALGWSRRSIERLAKRHGRTCDWSTVNEEASS